MKFIIYSDQKYEYQVKNFLDSVDYANVKSEVVYFTIGFDSGLSHPQLIKQRFEYDHDLPSLVLYTPKICLEALRLFDDDFCYVDTDIILSKRFNEFELDFSVDHPMLCRCPVDYPFIIEYNDKGEEVIRNEEPLMEYFGLKKRSMVDYLLACFFTFNGKSKDFIEEWMSICENKYLLKKVHEYMPFMDETPLNFLFWKRKITKNYGYKFINTHKFSTFNMCENGKRIIHTEIDGNPYEYCQDSNQVYFYHGSKNRNIAKEYKLFKPQMKITQVTPGNMQIPPNGWGAVEKIIWEYKLALEKQGNDVQIEYLDYIKPSDIVHIHIANLALEAHERGVPYVFSLHDHHVHLYGKDSEVYKNNLRAIKNSIISFTHAEFLVDYFEETDKLFYLSHGVNTEYFKPKNLYRENHRLLCLANNGFAHDRTFDRKGFGYAIRAAMELNLPITIAGPENNKNFFDANKDLLQYDKLTIIYNNPTEDEILKLYQEHSIFLHPSSLEAGHPNLTLLEAISCGLPVVGTYSGSKRIGGLIMANRNVESIKTGISEIIKKYEFYVDKTQESKMDFDWSVICGKLNTIYESINLIKKPYTSETSKSLYVETFSNIAHIKPRNITNESLRILTHEILKPTVEILGESKNKFKIEFWDAADRVYYSNEMGCNMWTGANREYFTNWKIKVYHENELLLTNVTDYSEKKVYIALDSKALGDTLAWFPYVEEFRKKHNCKTVCSTFHNYLFEKAYPEIEFISPGMPVHDLYKMFTIGWYYDQQNQIEFSKHPHDFRKQSLQKTASDILGLDYFEIKPKIDFVPSQRPISKKYFCIANHSTTQAKYWNNNSGWQDVVDYLKSEGYEVLLISRENDGYMGNRNPMGVIKVENNSIPEICNIIHHSEGFIGIGSGLSWLSWALNKKTVLISGFSRPVSEMSDCIRIFTPEPHRTCNGCFNDYKLDGGDWEWCPNHKGTSRQFECTKSITGQMVISELKKIIH